MITKEEKSVAFDLLEEKGLSDIINYIKDLEAVSSIIIEIANDGGFGECFQIMDDSDSDITLCSDVCECIICDLRELIQGSDWYEKHQEL